MAVYQFNAPAKEQPTQPKSNSGSGKNRIYEEFKTTLEFDELSLPANEPKSKSDSKENLETFISLEYPLIKINDYILNEVEINRLEIDSTDFIPTITLKVTFIHQTFLSREMPKDGDIISIAIRNKNDILRIIRNDYIITGVKTGSNTTEATGPVVMTFFGILFIPWLTNANFNFSFEGTSIEAMRKLSKDLNLGFATNEQQSEGGTDDKQVWISGYQFMSEFINKVTERAYKDDISFFDSWIDIYYNFNFVNVNKQLMSPEEEVDPAAWINNIDKDYTYGEDTGQDNVKIQPKVFSNYAAYRTSSFYINEWTVVNKSTQVSYDVGTKINLGLFEHNDKVYKNDESQKYWSIPLEPTYDPEKVNKYILLRGRATQQPTQKGKDLARANYPFTENNIYNPYMGIQYTISNPNDDNLQWDGNHHRNYIRAKAQNIINNKELDKLNVIISVNGLNMNIIRGDKTPVVLVKKDPVESAMVSPEADGNDLLEQFYSGWFYVKGFKIIYDKSKQNSIMSNFRQEFILTRREWPPPVATESLPKNENNV